MNLQSGSPSRRVSPVSAKAAYSRAARKKLLESGSKLNGVNAAIKHAIATGSLDFSDKLECAQRAMLARHAIAEARFETLQKAGKDDWEELKNELEDAWEDLSQSMYKLVARIKDKSD